MENRINPEGDTPDAPREFKFDITDLSPPCLLAIMSALVAEAVASKAAVVHFDDGTHNGADDKAAIAAMDAHADGCREMAGKLAHVIDRRTGTTRGTETLNALGRMTAERVADKLAGKRGDATRN